jgi:hypothetical protein
MHEDEFSAQTVGAGVGWLVGESRDPDRRPESERTNDVVEDVEPRVHREEGTPLSRGEGGRSGLICFTSGRRFY